VQLNDLYLVSQIVAAFAVVLSLVGLVLSIRQNTRAQKTLSIQSLTSAIAAINVPAMESPQLGLALLSTTAEWNAATREQRVVSHYFLFTFFKLCEQAWEQYRSGVLGSGQWAGWEGSMLRLFHSPGVVGGWWPMRSASYSPDFRAYLAGTVAPAVTNDQSLQVLFNGAAE